jgi:hypothetical protein
MKQIKIKHRRSLAERITYVWETRKWYALTFFPVLFGSIILGDIFPSIEIYTAIIGFVSIFFYLAVMLPPFFKEKEEPSGKGDES